MQRLSGFDLAAKGFTPPLQAFKVAYQYVFVPGVEFPTSPILELTALMGATQTYKIVGTAVGLGDGLDQLGLPTGRVVEESWQIQSPPLNTEQKQQIAQFLKTNYSGFDWRCRNLDNYQTYLCNSWDANPVGFELWQIAATLERTGHQEIDECIIRPSDLATTNPIIPLTLYLNSASRSTEARWLSQRFNGGIEERTSFGYNSTRDTWSFKAVLNEIQKRDVCQFLSDRCGSYFEFRLLPNVPGKTYTCEEWKCTTIGEKHWECEFTFKGSHIPYRTSDVKRVMDLFDFYHNEADVRSVMATTFASIDEKLEGSYDYLLRYKRDTYPLILNNNWLLVNSFHTVLGRGGYFPASAGPTEAQAVIARAAMYAYIATGQNKWRDMAIATGDALINYFYPVPLPPDWTIANGIRVPHWLINIKAPFTSKGAASTTGDPLNMGHFDLIVNFTNGVGFIPHGAPNWGDKVANIYRVYPTTDRLLWKNVYAKPLGGYEYPIDYWVTNVMLEGVISRQYSDSESPSGRPPTPTTETPGMIRLATPYTGQAKVVYSSYTGELITNNQLFEPYPMWRVLRPGEALAAIDVFPWAEDAYDFLWQYTSASKWLAARECTRYSEAIAADVQNPTAWYKKEDSPNPFSYPGSQVILANNDGQATTTRVASGDKKDWIQIDVPASTYDFPSAELQNFAVQAKVNPETTVYVEAACSQVTELEVVLSLSKNPFDFSQYYVARLPLSGGGTPVSRVFQAREFLLWDAGVTAWHPYIANDPVYKYSGNGGSATISRFQQTIDNLPRAAWRIVLDKNSGFAGAGFVILGAKPRFPLQIYCRNSGNVRLKIEVDGKNYYRNLSNIAWGLSKFDKSQFEDFDGKNPTGGYINKVEFEATGESTTDVWWIGGAPLELPAPVQTYKAALVSRIKTAHTVWCGDFKAVGSPSDTLPYHLAAVPFTANCVSDGKGGQIIDAWRGVPCSGYQYPAYYAKLGLWSRLDGVLDFLLASQAAYRDQNAKKTNGPFIGSYIWGYWDSGDLTATDAVNYFDHVSIDPNVHWCGYQTRPLLSCAQAWYRLATGDFPGSPPANLDSMIAKAKKITMDFLNWLSSFYVRRRSFQPPTDYKAIIDPEVNYHEPHQAAFILRSALYANLAGGNRSVTMRLIKASLDYLDISYVRSGEMQGSFAQFQPTFDGVYKEYFGFWHLEIVEALAILKSKQHLLNYPKCVYFIETP